MTTSMPALSGLLYWRKNPLLASSMVPLLVILEQGRFAAVGPDGVPVFDVSAGEVSGSLGRMGTFKITVGGAKYALVGRGSIGGLESGFSDGQRAFYARFRAQNPDAPAPRPAGAVDAVLNASAGATMAMWRDALAASGAAVH